MRILSLVLTGLVIGTGAARAEVLTSVDRFTGETKVETAPANSHDLQPQLVVSATWLGDQPSPDQELVLGFMVFGYQWRYPGCFGLSWLADGEPVNLGPAKRSTTILSGGRVVEFVAIPGVRAREAKRLAQAKKVEYRICQTEGELLAAELADLREVVRQALGEPLQSGGAFSEIKSLPAPSEAHP